MECELLQASGLQRMMHEGEGVSGADPPPTPSRSMKEAARLKRKKMAASVGRPDAVRRLECVLLHAAGPMISIKCEMQETQQMFRLHAHQGLCCPLRSGSRLEEAMQTASIGVFRFVRNACYCNLPTCSQPTNLQAKADVSEATLHSSHRGSCLA